MSKTLSRHLAGLLVSCAAAVAMTGTAQAGGLFDRGSTKDSYKDGYEGSLKDAPVACGREWSANVALTTDYVFRGFSQTDQAPAVQGGFDFSWCRFYAGVWASNLDFGGDGNGADIANIEIDYYLGLKQKLFGAEFDLGVIYYTYPNANDNNVNVPELNYVEFKAGVSRELHDNFTAGFTAYYSPEYTGNLGQTWFLETNFERKLFTRGRYEFVASGLVGFGLFEASSPMDDYTYWNAGLTVNVDKFALDVRYWDTDNSDAFCSGPLFQCDARVVGTVSASF